MPAVLPSSAEEGTADTPASAGVVLVKKLNSARFLAGQVQRVKDRSVLKVQNSKFPCARSSLRMKSDSRAFSVKCPTPSKSTATKFLLHNLRSCRHPCNSASAGVHPDRSCLRFFSAADYAFAAAFYLLTNTPRVGAFIYASPYRPRASRRRLSPPQLRRAAGARTLLLTFANTDPLSLRICPNDDWSKTSSGPHLLNVVLTVVTSAGGER